MKKNIVINYFNKSPIHFKLPSCCLHPPGQLGCLADGSPGAIAPRDRRRTSDAGEHQDIPPISFFLGGQEKKTYIYIYKTCVCLQIVLYICYIYIYIYVYIHTYVYVYVQLIIGGVYQH